MLRVGRENVRRAGVGDRLWLERHDAKRLPFADSAFAALMSNSIVHHIPEPRAVLAEMVRVTVAGGLLFVRDLARPSDDAAVRHLAVSYAGDANAHQQALFEASLRAALTLGEVRELVGGLGHDPAAVQLTSDRHWTWKTRMRDEG
jgi:ubiquinone/menaquinone biosynthesis C-methylase UbiE